MNPRGESKSQLNLNMGACPKCRRFVYTYVGERKAHRKIQGHRARQARPIRRTGPVANRRVATGQRAESALRAMPGRDHAPRRPALSGVELLRAGVADGRSVLADGRDAAVPPRQVQGTPDGDREVTLRPTKSRRCGRSSTRSWRSAKRISATIRRTRKRRSRPARTSTMRISSTSSTPAERRSRPRSGRRSGMPANDVVTA